MTSENTQSSQHTQSHPFDRAELIEAGWKGGMTRPEAEKCADRIIDGWLRSHPRATIVTVVEPDKATAEIDCPNCDGDGYNVVTRPEHGCGGDEERCRRICPVPTREQVECPTCGGHGTLPVADLSVFDTSVQRPPTVTE